VNRRRLQPLLALLPLLALGCATAVENGRGTALDATDLVAMTDDMAMKITTSPPVRAAIAQAGPLRVVVEPVENNMHAEVLPHGPADAFTARVRTLLARHAPDDFVWVMNRDAFRRLQRAELELGPTPDSVQPEYALTARFYSLTDETPERRSSAYLCVYDLTNLRTRTVLWTDKYELKKATVRGFLD